ncbi:MAG: dynamin family protein [Rhizobacter sp.]
MTSAFAGRFDQISLWRDAVRAGLDDVSVFLSEQGLADDALNTLFGALRERLSADKLVVAFVAEFSRGKSELINAIFFADTGRRVLPATPGRTTMCPVELAYDAKEPVTLALLPIATRLAGTSLSELRHQPEAWTHVPLDTTQPEQLSNALREVMGTQRVAISEARALGLWDESNPEDNPVPDDEGLVEVPAWRHALINYPHPLLRQGLVVIDTPGLNALGAEPELTLGLLPSAHATVFIVGADTGVTKSDMAIWRDHLGGRQGATFVVLNKIDALLDPLLTSEQVVAHIEAQRRSTASILGVEPDRVFALSARQALVARVDGDAAALATSRLGEFEAALSAELLPHRQQVLRHLIDQGVGQIQRQAARQLGDTRRQLAEQLLELRGLRGKSGARLKLIKQRAEEEAVEFEHSHSTLLALRGMQARMIGAALEALSNANLEAEIDRTQSEIRATLLGFGARKAFVALSARLSDRLRKARSQMDEVRDMLGGTFSRLNAEFGFGLALTPGPDLSRFIDELGLIERSYAQYLGLGQSLRLAQPQFMAQFRRMLLGRLSVVWDGARGDVERWSGTTTTHVEVQLHERRRGFQKRVEALSRIRSASGDLEGRLAELEQQDAQLQRQLEQLVVVTQSVLSRAAGHPTPSSQIAQPAVKSGDAVDLDLDLPMDEFVSVQRARA